MIFIYSKIIIDLRTFYNMKLNMRELINSLKKLRFLLQKVFNTFYFINSSPLSTVILHGTGNFIAALLRASFASLKFLLFVYIVKTL